MQRSLFWLLDHYPDLGEDLASVHRTALDHAELADRLGFTSLWLAEHHFEPLGTAANPAVVLAAIAQRTQRLRLGPAVAVLPLRNPIQVAEDYALVDVVSGGRLNLGLGAGSQALEFDAMGVDFERRKELFQESLEVLEARWRAAAAGERGPEALNVAPVQMPAPPIYVASMNEEGALAIGRSGYSLLTLVSPGTRDLSELASRLEAYRRGLREAGAPRSEAEAVVMVFAHASDSADAARRLAAPALGRLVRAMDGEAPPDPGALYDVMVERGTGLFGTREEVERTIEQYVGIGVEHLAFVSRFGGMDAQAAEKSLRLLAPRPSTRSARASDPRSEEPGQRPRRRLRAASG